MGIISLILTKKLNMFKLAVFLAVAAASPADMCMKEKGNMMTMAIKKAEMMTKIRNANLSTQQLEAIFEPKGDCDIVSGGICVAELTGVIMACIAEVGTGVGIAACVAEAIGVANDCYDCVCWVIEFLGFTC